MFLSWSCELTCYHGQHPPWFPQGYLHHASITFSSPQPHFLPISLAHFGKSFLILRTGGETAVTHLTGYKRSSRTKLLRFHRGSSSEGDSPDQGGRFVPVYTSGL